MKNTIIFIASLAISPAAWAIIDGQADKMQEANELYKNKKFQQSEKIYQELKKKSRNKKEKSIAHFNAGNSLYQQQKYKEALNEYYNAAQSADPRVRSKALNNLGNTYAKLGEKDKALKSYLSSLQADKNNMNVRRNIERLARSQKQKQNQQKQENQQNQKQGQQQQSQEQQAQQQQNQQNDPAKQQQQPSRQKPGEVSDEKKEMAKKLIEEESRNKVKRRLPQGKGIDEANPY